LINSQLKKACKKDCLFIFKIYNLGVKKNYFKNKKLINYEDHFKWFSNALSNSKIILFVCFTQNRKIGYIRFNKFKKDSVSISIILKSSFRNRGIASILLKKAIKKLQFKDKIKYFYAEVLKKNKLSAKFFLNNNFKKVNNNIFDKKNNLFLYKT
tara:strand:- start:1425 stop:1889 length:465 start_codon:yes stop_codon:yes gene_type:complete